MNNLTVRINFRSDELAKSVMEDYLEPADWIDLCSRFTARLKAMAGNSVILVISGDEENIRRLRDAYSKGHTIFRCRDVSLNLEVSP
jgi:hypothetical protein